MDALMNVGPGSAGVLVWVLWALIGVFEALVAQRTLGGRRVGSLDITVGIVAAVLGGYLSLCWLDQEPMQLFLISILAAIFAGGIALWLTGVLLVHFSKK
ncbi:MAG: hypothetical protein HDT06_06445 [Bacteroidales bacterium]|nr:hypothetical protein [Bacteroidales bacterium]MBD5216226.1 hypothetical protein [Bacteroidales bacterium]MBD5219330.1 hypothetical protein [Bacteroidales bacterium]MDE6436648.1 hypothetical protein [Muribaculaceae bacterium]